MFCRDPLTGLFTSFEVLMDQWYPLIFKTFIESNVALQQRADLYKRFFKQFFRETNKIPKKLQVLEIGSGTGIGSANIISILKNKFTLSYVALEKRAQLVSMTKHQLSYLLSSDNGRVIQRDGLHNLQQSDLFKLGFPDGKVDFYFAEHSTYSELYDYNKTYAYLKGLPKIINKCGLIFFVFQTEHAEIQKLVGRHVMQPSDYSKHIDNLDKVVKSLNFNLVFTALNKVNLTFPNMNHSDWKSIQNRESDLGCFKNPRVEKALHLMTFINKPPTCLNKTELLTYTGTLREHLQNNNQISIDEYLHVFSPDQCYPEISTKNDTSNNEFYDCIVDSVAHGVLRGTSRHIETQFSNKSFARVFYYTSYFTMRSVSNYQAMPASDTEDAGFSAFYQAAIETGQLMFINAALNFLSKVERYFSKENEPSWMAKGISHARLLIPFGIFAKKQEILTTSASMVVGGVAEMISVTALKKLWSR